MDIGGQAFTIADPGPPPTYGDVYVTIETLTNGETRFPSLSPTVMLALAYIVEFYYLIRHFFVLSIPFIGSWIPPVNSLLINLQPTIFRLTTVHLIFDDSRARLAPEKGGLGYSGACNTMEGIHLTVDYYKERKGGDL